MLCQNLHKETCVHHDHHSIQSSHNLHVFAAIVTYLYRFTTQPSPPLPLHSTPPPPFHPPIHSGCSPDAPVLTCSPVQAFPEALLDPRACEVVSKLAPAPRSGAVRGPLGLLDISKPGGSVLLARLAERLRAAVPGLEVVTYAKPTLSRPATAVRPCVSCGTLHCLRVPATKEGRGVSGERENGGRGFAGEVFFAANLCHCRTSNLELAHTFCHDHISCYLTRSIFSRQIVLKPAAITHSFTPCAGTGCCSWFPAAAAADLRLNHHQQALLAEISTACNSVRPRSADLPFAFICKLQF